MMKKVTVFSFLLFLAGSLTAGEIIRPVVSVFPGNPEELDLAKQPGYVMRVKTKLTEEFNQLPAEGSTVKFNRDQKNFYVTIEMKDTEVVCEGKENYTKLYNTGDGVVIMLKNEADTTLWEFIASPSGKFSSFVHPGPGCIMPAPKNGKYPVAVKSVIKGKINDNEKDEGWTAYIAIPLKELQIRGLKFSPEEKWTVLVARYNYSRFLPARETSGFPQFVSSHYETQLYAALKLEK